MTVRTAVHRPAAPFVVLLLAVLVHTAFGPLLACHATLLEQPVATVATVTASPESEPAACPGCVPDASPDTESSIRTTAAEDRPLSPVETDPCTPDRPCHSPNASDAADDPVLRGLDNPRDPGPALAARLGPDPVERPAVPTSTSSPMPPAAVLAPVAVLCVDRN